MEFRQINILRFAPAEARGLVFERSEDMAPGFPRLS